MNELNKIELLRTRAEKAEAECAELKGLITREVRLSYNCHCPQCNETRNKVEHALSTDCGKATLEKIKKLRDALHTITAAYMQDACNNCYPLPYPVDSMAKRLVLKKAEQALEETK